MFAIQNVSTFGAFTKSLLHARDSGVPDCVPLTSIDVVLSGVTLGSSVCHDLLPGGSYKNKTLGSVNTTWNVAFSFSGGAYCTYITSHSWTGSEVFTYTDDACTTGEMTNTPSGMIATVTIDSNGIIDFVELILGSFGSAVIFRYSRPNDTADRTAGDALTNQNDADDLGTGGTATLTFNV